MTRVIIPVKNYVGGHFTIHKGKVDANGVEIPGTYHQVADFDNLITDNGLNNIYTCPGGAFGIKYMYPRCYVGTGTTPPATTDTALASYLAQSDLKDDESTRSFVEAAGAVPAYWKNVKTYRFAAGTATGNVSEVATGWTNVNLFSRALILDGGGVPTTITVLADEYLDVTYECRNYIDKTAYAGVITISGVPYDVTYQPTQISSPPNMNVALTSDGNEPDLFLYSTQTLGTVYTTPSGSSAQKGGASLGYTLGSYYSDWSFTYGITEANYAGGVGSARFDTMHGKFQMNFTPKIPKDATKTLIITFRIIWARYP